MRQPLDLLALRPWLILAAFVVVIAAVGGLRDPASRNGSRTDAGTSAALSTFPETLRRGLGGTAALHEVPPMETAPEVSR